MPDMMDNRVVSRPTKRRHETPSQGSRPTRRVRTNDTENTANQVAAGGPLPPGADRRHERQRQPVFVLQVRPDGGRSNIAGSADPRRAGAGLVPAPIRAGRKPRRTNHLRERRTRGSKPARHRLFARFFAGTYTFTVPSFGVDTGQAATVQLAARTQTFLEVQSPRSWAGAGGDHFQRDTLYVRAISAYWAEKYFPTLTYLGPR